MQCLGCIQGSWALTVLAVCLQARVVELEAKLSAEQQRALKAEDALQTAQFQLSDAQADVDRLSRAVATAEGRGEKLADRDR